MKLLARGQRVKQDGVAETLGGRVYQPDSAEDLAHAVAEARITAPFELACAR